MFITIVSCFGSANVYKDEVSSVSAKVKS